MRAQGKERMKKLKFKLNEETGTLFEEDARRYFSRVGIATFLLVVVYFFGGGAILVAAQSLFPEQMKNAVVENLVMLIPLYGLAVPVFYSVLRGLPRDSVQPEKMSGGMLFKGLCVSLFVMMAGNYVSQLLLGILQALMGRTLMNPVVQVASGNSFWVNLFFIAILAPILEELVFRKLLCDRLLPLGEGYAVVLSAAIFGLIHGNLFQFLYAFLLGLVFGLIYVKTGRIRYTIVYHGILNLFGSVISLWLLEQVNPLMTEESLNRLVALSEQADAAALSEMIHTYLIPMLPLLAYELVTIVLSICGMIFLIVGYKKIRLDKGLLPPPEKGRVANVLLNGGVAAAIGAFAVIFVLSVAV